MAEQHESQLFRGADAEVIGIQGHRILAGERLGIEPKDLVAVC
jgi:hypothetical protein